MPFECTGFGQNDVRINQAVPPRRRSWRMPLETFFCSIQNPLSGRIAPS
jgi:hypothetical protein